VYKISCIVGNENFNVKTAREGNSEFNAREILTAYNLIYIIANQCATNSSLKFKNL